MIPLDALESIIEEPNPNADSMTANPDGIDLIIFDCDGVLVDSEFIANRVFADMINELGASVTLEYLLAEFAGQSLAYCYARVEALIGRPIPDGFLEAYRTRTDAAFASELRSVAGVDEVLDILKARGVEYCLASNGSHEETHFKLGITGLLSRFANRRFSAADVRYAKPAPDVFLHAAHQFGAAPSRCRVVEDTPTGVRAAVSAGMRVYGYCARTPGQRLMDAGAHALVDDLRKLPALWFRAESTPAH
jgi:HAD superfamily hydrolase (TIGR01509 family)